MAIGFRVMRTHLLGPIQSQLLRGRYVHVKHKRRCTTLSFHSSPMFASRLAADEAGPTSRDVGNFAKIRADDEIVKLAYSVVSYCTKD